MRSPQVLLMLVILSSLSAASSAPLVRDWSDCEYDLDRVNRSARDASYAASDANSKADELENCLNDPDTYDLLGDGCRSYRSDYESSLDQLQSELDTLNSRLVSVQYSCSYEFSLRASSGGGDSLCTLLKRYRGRLDESQLLSFCKTKMSEEDCIKCLSSK